MRIAVTTVMVTATVSFHEISVTILLPLFHRFYFRLRAVVQLEISWH